MSSSESSKKTVSLVVVVLLLYGVVVSFIASYEARRAYEAFAALSGQQEEHDKEVYTIIHNMTQWVQEEKTRCGHNGKKMLNVEPLDDDGAHHQLNWR